MLLTDFIELVGDEAAAELFDAKVRTVASWRRGERVPRPAQAIYIAEKTKGLRKSRVTFRECYNLEAA